MKMTKRKLYLILFKEYFWFYKESMSYMSHQSKVKTFFQAIPRSFTFIRGQHKHYRDWNNAEEVQSFEE